MLGEIQQIGQLLLTSKAFRDVLADVQFLLRDLTADAAATAAQKAGGAEGKLRVSDEERKKRGDAVEVRAPNKKDLESAKDAAKRGAKQAQDNLQDSAKQAAQWLDEKTPDDVKEEFLERVKQVIDSVERDPTSSVRSTASTASPTSGPTLCRMLRQGQGADRRGH